ncbi:MAG TPA: alpha/beta hydrolase [Ramlibacter sp.]|jgi:pimeloyl-ACP methyl ester carboxylesterase|uniref:alpha/beta hydrolase n=1 Tax=Ramlibacter sp. TaxID=1917967 RepID=UPI002D5BEB99|nr:alpha/beta hydrolase [Ramlibacter sp.]HZY19616.1 alpha/beta hydrolase [Ramlibacter sp.]
MSLIVFSHANSFPAATYGVLFRQLRSRGFTVKAVDKFGHDERFPVTNNWPHLIQQLHEFAQREVDKAGEPAFLVGHSLGGFLSILCAARHPEVARGVLLLDSPLLGGWKATALGAAKRTQLVGSVSPGRISRQRKNRWPSREAAFEHFRHKKAFARWDEQVLHDYVNLCMDDADGERVLGFDREVETAIYNTLPHNMERVLRAHPLFCPAAFIGGCQSEELRQVGLAMTKKVTEGRLMMLDGSHLFPMEKPVATAAAIEAALRSMAQDAP